MTVDSPTSQPEASPGEPAHEVEDPEAEAATVGDSASTRPYLVAAIGFLVVALVVGVVAGLQLVYPAPRGIGPLSFGKSFPIAVDMFLFGWLTIGLAGALVNVVARSGGVEIEDRSARLGAGLLTIGVIAGTVGIALGFSEGRRYLEYPLWADVFILAGMLVVARTVTSTARRSVVDAGPVRWYTVASVWWFVLAFVVGNIPGLSGLASTMQTSFFRASIIGLWLASAGVAVVYHLIPRLAGRVAFIPTRLTLLGFWSLAFVWALTAPTDLVFGPVPDWLETVGGIFSIGLVIPPLVIFTDVVLAMRGHWKDVHGDTTIRFVVLGGALFAMWPLLNLTLAFRGSSGITQFTGWVGATEAAALFGVFTAWLVAYVYVAGPTILGSAIGPRVARIHYFGTVVGLLIWILGSLVAGLAAGWTWVASANDAAVPTTGTGWQNTLDALDEVRVVVFIGLVVFSLAQIMFAGAALRRSHVTAEEPAPLGQAGEPDPELVLLRPVSGRRLVAGAVVLFAVAAVVVLVVPSLETSSAEATLRADQWRSYEPGSPSADGRAVYLQEGCWYCHTQEVRPIVTDVGLGPVSVAGDYVHETPALTGYARIGPDLMDVGARGDTADPVWVDAFLRDPRSVRDYSTMPSYDHLSTADLDALTAYITGSK